MRLSLVLLSMALAVADAATRVAVLEVGPKSGMVHRTEVPCSTPASADGVISFWSAVHGYGHKLQQAGMTLVPDVFRKPEAGLVISVKNVDLDRLPLLHSLMSDEGLNGVVGQQGRVFNEFFISPIAWYKVLETTQAAPYRYDWIVNSR